MTFIESNHIQLHVKHKKVNDFFGFVRSIDIFAIVRYKNN